MIVHDGSQKNQQVASKSIEHPIENYRFGQVNLAEGSWGLGDHKLSSVLGGNQPCFIDSAPYPFLG